MSNTYLRHNGFVYSCGFMCNKNKINVAIYFCFILLKHLFYCSCSHICIFSCMLQEPARLLQHLFYLFADVRTRAITAAGYFIAAFLFLFHRLTRTAYLYNGCLPWYNVVLTSRVQSSVKYSEQSTITTAVSCDGGISVLNHYLS